MPPPCLHGRCQPLQRLWWLPHVRVQCVAPRGTLLQTSDALVASSSQEARVRFHSESQIRCWAGGGAPWWHSPRLTVILFTRTLLSSLTSLSSSVSTFKAFMFVGKSEALGEKWALYLGLVINHWFSGLECAPRRRSWDVGGSADGLCSRPSAVIPDGDRWGRSQHHAQLTPGFPASGQINIHWVSQQPACNHQCSILLGNIQEIVKTYLFIKGWMWNRGELLLIVACIRHQAGLVAWQLLE